MFPLDKCIRVVIGNPKDERMDWLTLLAVLSLQPVMSANAEIALRCWVVRAGIVAV